MNVLTACLRVGSSGLDGVEVVAVFSVDRVARQVGHVDIFLDLLDSHRAGMFVVVSMAIAIDLQRRTPELLHALDPLRRSEVIESHRRRHVPSLTAITYLHA